VIVTWTTLRAREPARTVPWEPRGARAWQAGSSGAGRLDAPLPDGRWWSVLATWDDRSEAEVGPAPHDGLDVWHVVLETASSSGDAVLAGGARPFDDVPRTGSVDGAVAVVTFAGAALDGGKEREFFRRSMALGRDVATAPGMVTALLQAQTTARC